MRALKTTAISASLAIVLTIGAVAQQPTPPMIVVQAANATPASTPAPVRQADPAQASTIEAAMKALQEVKAANEETLKKQEEMLQRLDELQKAAEQLKTFSKRS